MFASSSVTAQERPNIVVIFGDDIGYWNVGAYSHGLMGATPNIDRIAREGILFTDHYGQPSRARPWGSRRKIRRSPRS
jgi:arylsulfatase